MFSTLFLLFVGVPLVELWLLLRVGETVGAVPTVALVVGTGMLGAALARREGMRTIAKLNEAMSRGEMPQQALLDGLCIFLGGALLLTPGILTDVLGFSLLFAPTRPLLQSVLARWVQNKIQRAGPVVTFRSGGFEAHREGGYDQKVREGEEKIYDQSWGDEPPAERSGSNKT